MLFLFLPSFILSFLFISFFFCFGTNFAYATSIGEFSMPALFWDFFSLALSGRRVQCIIINLQWPADYLFVIPSFVPFFNDFSPVNNSWSWASCVDIMHGSSARNEDERGRQTSCWPSTEHLLTKGRLNGETYVTAQTPNNQRGFS